MYITHINNQFSEDIVLKENTKYPQYVHEVVHGGIAVSKGIRTMPAALIEHALKNGTSVEFIKQLTDGNNRVGFILAAGNNTWAGYLPNITLSEEYPTNKMTVLGISQIYAGQLANRLGKFSYLYTDSTSCISGHSAWFHTLNLLSLRYVDAMVVVSVDNGCCEEYLNIFGENGLSRLVDEERDLDKEKFRLGQGCNITVFENTPSLRISRNEPLAKVKDVVTCFEQHTNPMGVSPSGEGYRNILSMLGSNYIDFIKTHGTFTDDNAVENAILDDKYPTIPRVNYKLRIGHTMGASTAVETCLAIQEKKGTFLSLGAGMGNVFSGALVEIL